MTQLKPLAFLSLEELDSLTDRLTDKEIGELYGLCRTAATQHRKKLGVKSYGQKTGKRRYSTYPPVAPHSRKRAFSYIKEGLDVDYFEEVNSPVKAYWLGLLLADGWIVTESRKPRGFAVGLKGQDRYLLDHFGSCLKHPYLVRQERSGRDFYQIKVTSEKMAHDLMAQGILPNKSLIATLPSFAIQSYPKHLLRGYFDGDGCAMKTEAKFTCGSVRLLEQIQSICSEASGSLPCYLHECHGKYGPYWELKFYGDSYEWFSRWLYSDLSPEDPVMIRKQVIALNFRTT